MIGVAASQSDQRVIEEFFELFKTPWQLAVPGRKYRVLLCDDARRKDFKADVYLVFGAAAGTRATDNPSPIEFSSRTLPVYGPLSTFETTEPGILQSNGKPVAVRRQSGDDIVWRIGYDLFGEVRHLLTRGQPEAFSSCPTLELHIEILRQLLRESKVEFIEVPPTPYGKDFICCLTHDVDFFGIRRHTFDRTMLGFIARGSVLSITDALQGRRTIGEAARNLRAVLSVPFVALGLARDFWQPFEDYAAVEDPSHSTFFMVPFQGRPGVGPDGRTDATRAVAYDLTEVASDVQTAARRGSEVAIHGLDAWRDARLGREEKARLTGISRQERCGVRMHWLYFNETAPRVLEEAGFDYDSTWGYNDTVGFRGGTLQAFRFPGTSRLLELPLAIMDSALFSGRRLGLEASDAEQRYRPVIDDARKFGGALVVNWHCRSLAPERLWGRAYRSLLSRIGDEGGVTFTTAQAAVDWFRWRRSVRFIQDGAVVRVSAPAREDHAGVIRVHRRADAWTQEDLRFPGGAEVQVPILSGHTQLVSNSIH